MNKSITRVRCPLLRVRLEADKNDSSLRVKLQEAIKLARVANKPKVEILVVDQKHEVAPDTREVGRATLSLLSLEYREGEHWCYGIVGHETCVEITLWLQ